MRPGKEKNLDKQLKLPQINSKTSTSFSTTEASNSRIRPSSSSKVNDLEKNLFSQLSQYDDIGKKTGKKSKTRKQIQPSEIKQIKPDWVDLQAPYLKKIQKLMPQTYMKLLESKKPQPLQQTNKAKQKKYSQPQSTKPFLEGKLKTSKQQKRQSSFTVAEREVQQIFKQYLEEEGLSEVKQIKSEDLKQLNEQIKSTQQDINSLRKTMYEMVQRFGAECINFNLNIE